MMNFLAKIAFVTILSGILPAFAGICDTPKVKKQLDEFLFAYFDKSINLKNKFYLKPIISFNKDLGVQMEIKELYKGRKDTLCAVKVRLNALHAEIPNINAFEKFLYENDRDLYNSCEINKGVRENMENILRIYAYNKWSYNKGYMWHFTDKFDALQKFEDVTFYRVKFGDVQEYLISRDFLMIDLNKKFTDGRFAHIPDTFYKFKWQCQKDEDYFIGVYDSTFCYAGNCVARCNQLEFWPTLEKNFEWITGKKLEN